MPVVQVSAPLVALATCQRYKHSPPNHYLSVVVKKSLIESGASFCLFAFPLFFTTVEYSIAESGSFLTEHK